MNYTPQAWADNDPSKPVSAAREAYQETQYAAAMNDTAALYGHDVRAWAPNTQYAAGQAVVSPTTGDVVTAATAHTSAATYSGLVSAGGNWNISTTFSLVGSRGAVPFYNMLPANFPNWRKAVAKVRAGSGFAKLACVGDSTTWGHGSGAANEPAAGYPAQLIPALNSRYAPATQGLVIPTPNGFTDSRWGIGTGWSHAAFGFGMLTALTAAAGAAGALTFTPGINCDTFDIYYAQSSGNGVVQASVDGGAATPVTTTAASNGVGKTTITAPAGSSHVLTLQTITSGAVYIYGVEAYLSTAPSIRVGNVGAAGSTTSSSTGWSADTSFKSLPSLRAYAPDLTVLMLGINDATQAVPVATWQANMQAIITAAKASGDVILMSVVPSSSSSGNPTLEASYQGACLALAQSNNIGYVDMFSRLGSYTTLNGLGMMSDGLHPNSLGYADMMAAVFASIASLG